MACVWLNQFHAAEQEFSLVIDMLHHLRAADQVVELFGGSALILSKDILESGIDVFYLRLQFCAVSVQVILGEFHTLISRVYSCDTPDPKSRQRLREYPSTTADVNCSQILESILLVYWYPR